MCKSGGRWRVGGRQRLAGRPTCMPAHHSTSCASAQPPPTRPPAHPPAHSPRLLPQSPLAAPGCRWSTPHQAPPWRVLCRRGGPGASASTPCGAPRTAPCPRSTPRLQAAVQVAVQGQYSQATQWAGCVIASRWAAAGRHHPGKAFGSGSPGPPCVFSRHGVAACLPAPPETAAACPPGARTHAPLQSMPSLSGVGW